MLRTRIATLKTIARLCVVLSGLLLTFTPSPAFAHDNLGGDELAVANWMLIAAIVVAVMGVVALAWAARAGQFSNVEESKYRMLDLADDYDALMATAAERDRARRTLRAKSQQPAEVKVSPSKADRAAQV
jgi:cbb3-type cytochrome oxidase maturation protein